MDIFLTILVTAILVFIIYKKSKSNSSIPKVKSSQRNDDEKLPSDIKIEIQYLQNLDKEYENQLSTGDSVKIWANPNKKYELRCYLKGYFSGEGHISTFENRTIYNHLVAEKFVISNKVVNISEKGVSLEASFNNNLTILIDSPEYLKTQLLKKYKPRETTSFCFGFVVKNRLLPKDNNKNLSIEINVTHENIDEIVEALTAKREFVDSYVDSLNDYIWLNFDEERFSIVNRTKRYDVIKPIRAKLSGCSFRVEVIFDRATDNYRKQELIDNKKTEYFYYFNIYPVYNKDK